MIYIDSSETSFIEIFKGIFLPLLAVFMVELAYRDILQDFSESSVPEMQKDLETMDTLKSLLDITIVLGSTKVLCLVLVISFMLMDKASSMYLWSTSISMYFLANILESMYA